MIPQLLSCPSDAIAAPTPQSMPVRASRVLLTAGLLLWTAPLLFVAGGCGKGETKGPKNVEIEHAKSRQDADVPIPKVHFTDITAKAGIAFTHQNGAFGKKLLPETLGGGVAFCDFDKDGNPDLLFINSRYWPGFEEKDQPPPTLVLYRNKGNLQFENITKEAGLAVTLYGMGVTVGDYDNDGWPDLFITGVGGNKLFRNAGDKKGLKFIDVTPSAGDLTDADGWPDAAGDAFLARQSPVSFPSSAAFLDYDNDGKLDLFVCNYVTWSPRLDLSQKFTILGDSRAYGPPKAFMGTHCTLYRNVGKGKFENVTAKAGIQVAGHLGEAIGKALGVAVCDVDENGWPDIFVANDTVPNFFFHNQRNGAFKEIGKPAGVAYAEGAARGAMGIDIIEYRAGKLACCIGNFQNEPNTLLRLDDQKQLLFSDVALIEGLAGPSRIVLKFGLFFFDFDLDGFPDLLTCNGHLEPAIHRVRTGEEYKQPVQLFWNTGGRRAFEPVTEAHSGSDLFQKIVGRGCAFADADGDGDLDIVLIDNGGAARLLKNEGGTNNHFARILLEGNGQTSNTSAIGARVFVTAGGKTQKREVTSAKGYLSQSEFALTFGLGKTDKIEKVEVIWPGLNAGRSVVTDLAVDRIHVIRQEKQ